MTRVTDDMIRRRVARLQKEGLDVALDGAYGQWKIVTKNEARDLSPRAPNREIWLWLEAVEIGFEQGRRTAIAIETDTAGS